MICPNCNKVYKDEFDFCPYCGTSKPKLLTCPKCGFESNEFKFCPKCGVELTKKIETQICSYCGHEYPIDRPYCEKCGNGFSKMLKPKNKNANKQKDPISDQSKKMLIKYVDKFAIEKNRKNEIKKEIEDGKITTKTEVSRIVRNIEKGKKEKEAYETRNDKYKNIKAKKEEEKIAEMILTQNHINNLLKSGKYNEAIHYTHKELEKNKKDHYLWNLLGVSYSNIEQYGAALNCYEKAIKFGDDYDGYWGNAANTLTVLGVLNAKENNFNKARSFFEEALIYYTEAMKRSNEEKYIVQYRKVLIYLGRT